MNEKVKSFFSDYESAIIAWFVMVAVVVLGLYLQLDETVLGAILLLIGLAGHVFSALLAWIALVPFAGPFIAKVLELPFLWIINGVGYLVSLVAIRRGYSKDVLTYRSITVVLIVGIAIGYVLGKVV